MGGWYDTKIRRRYAEAFKEEAVRLVSDSSRPVAQVARDLGIANHLLYRWRGEQGQGWNDWLMISYPINTC